jgi:AAA domain/PHP domain
MRDSKTNSVDRGLATGAVFHRCALQVNPHSYSEQFRGEALDGDAASHALAIVDKAVSIGVTVLAITDHNSAADVPHFQRAAQGKGVHIFPGFELSSADGVHVLCIYEPRTTQEQLSRYLGQLEITSTARSADLSSMPLESLLTKVRVQGGVTIAAHATNEKGILTALSGQACVKAWRSEDLRAIQIPGAIDELPREKQQIVENRDVNYKRTAPADDDLAVAVVNAKDVTKAVDLDDRAATCWIKMSEVGIEGLRQAFLDPGSRIRLNPKEGVTQFDHHAEVLSLGWEGGFLDGVELGFNPNLNVLIGGRGTGKSTILESIRYVLGLVPIGDEARRAHDGVVKHVLKNGTKLTLRVCAHRPARDEFRIERTVPNPPIVRNAAGDVLKLTPTQVLPRVEMYGQHEISELTRSAEKLTRLLERFVDGDDDAQKRKLELKKELEKSRRALRERIDERTSVRERLAALPGLEETEARFKAAGLEAKLSERSHLVREEQILASIPERLATLREGLELIRSSTPIDMTFLSERALAELPGAAILSQLNTVLAKLDAAVGKAAATVDLALTEMDRGVGAVRAEWGIRRDTVNAEYEKILRDLQKSRVDGEEFIRLRRQIESLRPLRERNESLERVLAELSTRRRSLLAEWEDAKAAEFRRLDKAAKKVNRTLKERVQVVVTGAGDREPFLKILREEVGGRLSEATEKLRAIETLSLTEFVDACRIGAEAVSKKYGIPPAQAERLAKADDQVLSRIEELDLPATTVIRLNTASQNEPADWKGLDELSTGQKATAVLLLLLLESDAPLIVDQPEDDLDNRFITEGIVPRMRDEKQRRQFIFSTHNANIPVLGDAEMIIGLTASGDSSTDGARVRPTHVGSIDDQHVREMVEEILEGGKDAFERRRRKYNF